MYISTPYLLLTARLSVPFKLQMADIISPIITPSGHDYKRCRFSGWQLSFKDKQTSFS